MPQLKYAKITIYFSIISLALAFALKEESDYKLKDLNDLRAENPWTGVLQFEGDQFSIGVVPGYRMIFDEDNCFKQIFRSYSRPIDLSKIENNVLLFNGKGREYTLSIDGRDILSTEKNVWKTWVISIPIDLAHKGASLISLTDHTEYCGGERRPFWPILLRKGSMLDVTQFHLITWLKNAICFIGLLSISTGLLYMRKTLGMLLFWSLIGEVFLEFIAFFLRLEALIDIGILEQDYIFKLFHMFGMWMDLLVLISLSSIFVVCRFRKLFLAGFLIILFIHGLLIFDLIQVGLSQDQKMMQLNGMLVSGLAIFILIRGELGALPILAGMGFRLSGVQVSEISDSLLTASLVLWLLLKNEISLNSQGEVTE
ncbi:hypothetical protein ACE5IS_00705 [Leptospira wolffii]|uniref:Uncharacterized protein n=1 Tax=Leptospira wolffii TaxID=409998 RepID=A0ABV5BJA6_9LEPT